MAMARAAIFSGPMPCKMAPSGLWALATMATPYLVFFRKSHKARLRAMATATATMRSLGTADPRMLSGPAASMGMERSYRPNMTTAPLWMIRVRPVVATIAESTSPLSLRNSSFSRMRPENGHDDHGPTGVAQHQRHPGRGGQVENHVRPEHVDFAVGELHDVHDAEDQSQAQGHKDVDPAPGPVR